MSASGWAAGEDSSGPALERYRDEGALDRIARLAAAAIGAPIALVQLARDDGRDAVRAVTHATDAAPTDAPVLTAVADRAATTAECVSLGGLESRASALRGEADGPAIKAAIAVPIAVPDGHVRGAIAVAATEARAWTDTDRTVLRDLAGVAAGVIESRVRASRLRYRTHRAETRLREAEKMEAIGRLAGGVAHDFNNLMLTVWSYTQLFLERTDLDADMRDDLNEVATAVNRAIGLAGRLLNASRKQMPTPRVVDLNGVVTQMQKPLRRLIGDGVRLVTRPEAAAARIKADPGALEQVILNLVLNARDAMPDGGTLTIRTAEREVAEDDPAAPSGAGSDSRLDAGRYVVLAVEDTGVGMAPDVQERIFEPFFTTKPEGKGTGLGLATAYGTVKQSGGAIEVQSEAGRGTTFRVYLPAESATAIGEPRHPDTAVVPSDRGGVPANGQATASEP